MNRARHFIQRTWQAHAPLTLFGLLMSGFTLFMIVGLLVDDRTIMGQPAWMKPTKFGISIATYAFSLAWLLSHVRQASRPIRRSASVIAWMTIVTGAVEIVIITLQAARGTTSHFNVATPLDTTLFAIMGAAITILWTANVVFAAILLFHRFQHPAAAWSIRLGFLITLIGMALGYLMTSPTAQQMASWQEGAPITVIGAHSVGVPDGGPGIPILGWSTEGGDLRIPHFVGLHALQFVPLVGWYVMRQRGLDQKQQTALVCTGALGYLGLVALVTWQALRAQPLIAPDSLTLGALGLLLAATALAAGYIVKFMKPEQSGAASKGANVRPIA